MSENIQTILIYRIGQLGDTLISMPAINAIRTKYKNHNLVLLTDRHKSAKGYISSWDVLGPTGWFSDVVYYDAGNNKLSDIYYYLLLAVHLRRLKLRKIFNLSPRRTKYQSIRDKLFFKFILNIKEYYTCLYNDENQHIGSTLPESMPEWRRLMSIVECSSNAVFRLPVLLTAQESAKKKLLSANIKIGTRLLALGVGTKMPAKQWPTECYSMLGSLILESFSDMELIIVGGPEDEPLGDTLCRTWGIRAHNFAGKLSVYESSSVLCQCEAYIGCDSGAMHLAAMSGIHCVALFSARDYPGKWSPYGDGHVILRHTVECEGCMAEICKNDNKCMKLIGVNDVFNAIVALLSHQLSKSCD